MESASGNHIAEFLPRLPLYPKHDMPADFRAFHNNGTSPRKPNANNSFRARRDADHRHRPGHFYLHGFTPDDTRMIFTGQRHPAMCAKQPNVLNLYTIDIATKKETQPTKTQALDDGAEYNPDGTSICFNSNRTGLMQLWRMIARNGPCARRCRVMLPGWRNRRARQSLKSMRRFPAEARFRLSTRATVHTKSAIVGRLCG
jgi:hypothetical protein